MLREFKLNPFFRVILEEPIRIELPLEKKMYECEDFRLVQAVTLLTKTFTQESATSILNESMKISEEEAEEIFTRLNSIGLIVDNQYHTEEFESAMHWQSRGWGDAFYLHIYSRDIEYSDDIAYEQEEAPEQIRKEVCKNITSQVFEIWETPAGEETIQLPKPQKLPEDRNLDEILKARRSNGPWNEERLFSEEELSQVLYYGSLESLEARLETEKLLETNPENILNYSSFSALETRLVILRDTGSIKRGVYHYDIKEHSLIRLKLGNFQEDLINMCIGQRQLKGAAFSLIITAYWKKYFQRYNHPRAYRNLLVNAGELAQKYLLLGTMYNMSQFITPAFEDKKAEALMECNGYEFSPIYSITLG